MIRLCLFCVYFFSIFSEAQQVVPLFRDNSLKTYVTLPFKLRDATNNDLAIFNMEIVTGKINCHGMIDPFISSNFLLKCTDADSVSVNVYFYLNGQLNKILYGPLSITKISDNGVIPPGGNNSDPYAAGRGLYQTNCISCHANPYSKPNKTSTQISSAIINIGQMQSLILTTAEIKDISNYLSNLP